MDGLRSHIAVVLFITVSVMAASQTVPWSVPAVSTNQVALAVNCVPTVDGNSIKEGDYIGVFSDPGKCFGIARWKDTVDFRIIVYGNDGNIDGFNTGEKLNFRIWLKDENCTIEHTGGIESDNPLVFSTTSSNRINSLNFVRLQVVYPATSYCQNDAVLKPSLGYTADNLTFTSGPGLAIDPLTGSVNPAGSQPGNFVINIASPVCLSHSALQLTINQVPEFKQMPDTFICGESLTLSAPQGFSSVKWSTGSVTDQVVLKEPSVIWYRLTNQEGCSNADTFRVDKTSLESVDYDIDNADCYHKGSLRINGNVVSNGSPPYSYKLTGIIDNLSFDTGNDLPEGVYALDVINSNGCILRYRQNLVVRKECLDDTPVFTPNDDGLDDRFFIEFEGKTKVYDRNGVLKRVLNGPAYFDGLDETGAPLPMGTYLLVSENGGTLTLTVIR